MIEMQQSIFREYSFNGNLYTASQLIEMIRKNKAIYECKIEELKADLLGFQKLPSSIEIEVEIDNRMELLARERTKIFIVEAQIRRLENDLK